MTVEAVLEHVAGMAASDDVRRAWDQSLGAMPEGVPEFLTDPFWREYSRWCGFSGELDERLARVAATVRADPALCHLAWHCYWRVFLSAEPCPPNGWPEPSVLLGEDAGLFYLLVAFAFVPLMRQRHRQWGFPENVTRETARQVRCYCEDTYRRGHDGRHGIYLGQLGWLRHYTRERYVRLGRLEFWLGANPYRLEVLRHRQHTARVVALAAHGTRFAEDGTIYRDPQDYREGEGWTATIERDDRTVAGLLLDPNGRGTRRRVVLRTDEWTDALRPGDPVLMLHIPSGGGLTPEACRDSFAEAAAFFPRLFPAEVPRAIVCVSWIFSPQLQEIFPPTANLCSFQRNLFLFPVASGPWDGLWFVFLTQGPLDLDAAPAETSLQRGILDYLRQGHRWRQAGMFFLLADLAKYGSEPYRSQWPPPEDSHP
jgi:hypothetical protein